tara:strand:- start:125513 stop:126859 length:1347 start_codon:yes stop_codon:yes gene_type:complete
MNENPVVREKGNVVKVSGNNPIKTLFRKGMFMLKAQLGLIVFFFKLKQKQILFFGSHIHRIFQNGQYFNRFYDSMVDFHGLQNKVYNVEYQKINEPIYNKKAVISLNTYLDYHKLVNKVYNKFRKRKPLLALKQYDQFCNDLSGLNLKLEDLRLSENHLIEWSEKVNTNNMFFERLYKKVKPQKVIFLGYYGLDDLYAALLAANKLGIKTIDFQHGPQTNVHLAFSCWNKIPEKGFNSMPVEFWNWDQASKNNIDTWANTANGVKAKVVGQPYLGYWMHKMKNENIKKQYVFYSLQTHPFSIEDFLTPQIIALIKRLKYNWVLRLHPRNNLDIDELKLFLKTNKIENKAHIQDAFNVPLPEVLTASVLHITNYSGCLIEAYQLGVPTLLINEVGHEMFSEYIDNKLVYYLNQNETHFQQAFEDVIKNCENLPILKESINVFNPLGGFK